jgi:hypothetical protein
VDENVELSCQLPASAFFCGRASEKSASEVQAQGDSSLSPFNRQSAFPAYLHEHETIVLLVKIGP